MIGLLWVARLLVAAVFRWAGVAKLLDLAGTRRAVGEFGVLLPWTVVAAGVVALGLLVVFSGVVARLLRKGKRPVCACFGAGSAVISGRTLARNGLLGGSWDCAGVARVGVAVVAAAGGCFGRRVAGRGARAVDRSAARWGWAGQLLFVHPGCGPCSRIVAELPQWRTRLSGKASVLLIGRGTAESLAALDGEILVQHGSEVAEGYFDVQGRIAAPFAVGTYAIRELLETTA
ncbi:MauE/DoxX family redox-associated membrane protein [Lentzea kentuckyensis]|uniref:MauE/DoxX family redox-associated membrane protein n=1 Tax=Lentzea kentuckyensis TaxID=360086 RepID=UPI00117A5D24|nr:MauE/DoxX family redox-associated membrane protein [Lentzea kentuckyensis]